MDEMKKILVRINSIEETVLLALSSEALPPEVTSIASVLKMNRDNILQLYDLLDKYSKDGGHK